MSCAGCTAARGQFSAAGRHLAARQIAPAVAAAQAGATIAAHVAVSKVAAAISAASARIMGGRR